MADQKDRWDKADVILKPVGGLLTAFAVALLGFFGSRALDRRQAEDNKFRLYTDLLSKREDSETAFRKDMFGSIFSALLAPAPGGYDQQVLNMELLSYNFSEDVDLAPVFNLLYKQISNSRDPRTKEYLLRLERAASEVNSRQLATLEGAGAKVDGTINIDKVENQPGINVIIDANLSRPPSSVDDSNPAFRYSNFKVEALSVDRS